MNRVKKMLHGSQAYRRYQGNGICAAIVDTGLSPHPDIASHIAGFYDAISHHTVPYDNNGHGTHVSGILAGNGSLSRGLYSGIAPATTLVGVKVLNEKGNGNIQWIMKGLDWILLNQKRYHIQIVNISIGTNDPAKFKEDCEFVKKVNSLWDAGMVVVCAAGNNGPDPYTISAPGNSRKIITVGTFERQASPRTSLHSGMGPTFSCIKKPDIVAPGLKVTSCASMAGIKKGHPYTTKSGTSMSTPMVAGAISLLLEKEPFLSPKEIKIRLKNSSTDLHLPHEKQGWGHLHIDHLLGLTT